MGEDYEVYPGNVRTKRHRFTVELDFEPDELELANEVAQRIDAIIDKAMVSR